MEGRWGGSELQVRDRPIRVGRGRACCRKRGPSGRGEGRRLGEQDQLVGQGTLLWGDRQGEFYYYSLTFWMPWAVRDPERGCPMGSLKLRNRV